jgi:hypothetical protein
MNLSTNARRLAKIAVLVDDAQPSNFKIVFLFGALLGLCYALWLLPLDFVLGHAGLWQMGDPGAHVSALHAYLNDGWHQSLLKTVHLNYPQGINAAFADIIPILALPTKLLAAWLPADVNYFGYWIVFAYLLQGGMAAALLFHHGFTRWTWLGLGVMIFLLAPAMLFRVHAHTALTSHGYILGAWLLYFLLVNRRWPFWRVVAAHTVLACVALLTHPYLYALVVPIFLASLIDHATRHGHWLRALLAALLSSVPVLFVLWIGGYLDHNPATLSGQGGFGINSMNLVAPIMGGQLIDIAAWRDQSGLYGSLPMPYNATGSQFEGYNHLGFGILMACLIVMISQWRWLVGRSRHYRALVGLAIGLTLYALSSRAYFADQVLWSIELPGMIATLAEQFRASGRFFWPVGYLITLVAFVGIKRLCSQRFLTPVLACLLILQFVDTAPLRTVTRAATTTPAPSVMTDDWWQHQITRADVFYLFPTFGCGADPFADIVPAQRLAATHGVPFNTGLIARGHSSCAEKEAALASGLQPNSLYLFLAKAYSKEQLENRFGAETINNRCQSVALGIVCVAND